MQRGDLIEQPVIARGVFGRFGGQRRMREPAEHAQPIIDRDEDDAAPCEIRAIVDWLGTAADPQRAAVDPDNDRGFLRMLGRSEEHTSELQSLMRISYAVFCLKKKHNTSMTDIARDYSHHYIKMQHIALH